MQHTTTSKGNGKLLFGIIAGITSGALIGGLWPEAGASLHFIGKLFVRFLLMLVMPLIIAAMVVGISRLGDIRKLGPLGGRTMAYYLGTTALSVLTGILLVLWIQPGKAGMEHAANAITRAEAPYRIETDKLILSEQALPDLDLTAYSLHLTDRNLTATILGAQRTDNGMTLAVEAWRERGKPVAGVQGEGVGIRFDPLAEERFMREERNAIDILKEVVEGLIPSNIFRAMADNEILPVILFSLLLGAALSMTGHAGQESITSASGGLFRSKLVSSG